jgi:hypothetical protein
MASNAERQAAYRQRHADNGGGRINYAVTAHAEAALRRLAAHHGVTRRAALERLITEAESAIVDELRGDDQTLYYAAIPRQAEGQIDG